MYLERKKAIRLLWSKASERGFDSDYLHELLSGLVSVNMVNSDSIKEMTSQSLSNVFYHVFKMKVRVYDDPMTHYIRGICKADPEKQRLLDGILRHYNKVSVYQLQDHQKRFVIGYLKQNKR